MDTLKTITIANTGEKVGVDSNLAIFPENFFRVSPIFLIGQYRIENEKLCTLYLFIKLYDGTYTYVGILEIKPLETKRKITSFKNLFQLRFFGGMLGHSKMQEELNREETDAFFLIGAFKYVFGRE